MLFNSYEFIFLFLPLALFGFFSAARWNARAACVWLALTSLGFYAWWNPANLPVLLLSIIFNYGVGRAIAKASARGDKNRARAVLTLGIVGDLAALAYYKYAAFLITNGNAWLELDWPVPTVSLPLGISFFTFTQIAFLVDTYQDKAREPDPWHYALFVTYFPHLIAGPILHHGEMMPQFAGPTTYRLRWRNVATGLSVFVIGLCKKTILADGIAPYAGPVFAAAQQGSPLTFADAWGGALAYSFQLYFDFSGYSDMAVGLSYLFGIRLPLNFHSPYKSTSIIQFWRRWHMTLSRFLKEYLYIPLGGNRQGPLRRYVNLLATMLLGGLWHGANWTFVVWGAIHGMLLAINHLWRSLRPSSAAPQAWRRGLATVATFCCVVVAWVPFRAADLETTVRLWSAMVGMGEWHGIAAFDAKHAGWRLGLLAFIAFALPNTQQIVPLPGLGRVIPSHPIPRPPWRWRPSPGWAWLLALASVASLLRLSDISEFIYFNF